MPIKKRTRVPLTKPITKRNKIKYKCPLCGHNASVAVPKPINKEQISNTIIF